MSGYPDTATAPPPASSPPPAFPPVPPLWRPRQPYPLRTRKPTGTVPPPRVLIEGEEKAGKSWTAAAFTGDPRICHTWWVEWSELPCADEYGRVPGARFELVEHDGVWWSVLSALEQIHEQARKLATAEAVPMLVIDTMGGEWAALTEIGHLRTMASPSVQNRIRRNPQAAAEQHKIPMNVWNDLANLHGEFMRLLHTFPGVVLMLARGKETAALDDDGRPIPGEKSYRVGGQKDLAYDATAWVRMVRNGRHKVIGARSTRAPLRVTDTPQDFRGLAWLIFDTLGYEPAPWTPPPPPPARPAAERPSRESTRPDRPANPGQGQQGRQDSQGAGRGPAGPGGRVGDVMPVSTNWDGELRKLLRDERDDPARRREKLQELWSAARLGNAPASVIAKIDAAGKAAAAEVDAAAATTGQQAPASTPAADPATSGTDGV